MKKKKRRNPIKNYIDGMACLVPNMEENRRLIQEYINGEYEEDEQGNADNILKTLLDKQETDIRSIK